MITVDMQVAVINVEIPLDVTAEVVDIPTDVDAVFIEGVDPYTGEYDVTPTAAEQVLNTAGLRMTQNVVVHPIPSNYGLITWNGSILTVS